MREAGRNEGRGGAVPRDRWQARLSLPVCRPARPRPATICRVDTAPREQFRAIRQAWPGHASVSVVGCEDFAHGYPCTAGSGAPGTLESNVEALAVLLVDQVLHQDSRLAPPHQRSHPLIATPLTPLNSVCCSISSDARTAGGLLTLLTSRSGWRT